jgi:Zn finger protein HypA/HybF involved in hydrogenase expression
MKRNTTYEFINKAITIHGDKYDYSLVDYKKSKLEVIIICKEHGKFKQTPNSHLQNRGCPKCGGKNKLMTNEFIEKAKLIHDNKYDYSIVDYINNSTHIKIICDIHGVFKQTSDSHLRGSGCPKCANKNVTTNEFIIKAKLIHVKKYDYSLVNYINNISKVKIICYTHGIFEQTPNSHLNGEGCPTCKSSKGELLIKKYLDEHNVEYIKEKIFDNCRGIKRTLSFDFYLPKQNMLLEYDGIQHFIPIKYFGGKKTYDSLKKRDEIKNSFAKNNNISLLRIKHNEVDNINQILKEII